MKFLIPRRSRKTGHVLVVAFAIACVCALGSGRTVLGAPQVANPKEKVAEIKETIQKNNQELNTKRRQRKSAVNDLLEIQAKLRVSQSQLNQAHKSLQVLQSDIQRTETKIGTARRHYDQRRGAFEARIGDIYKNHNVGALEMMFAPKDLTAAIEFSYLADQILKKDFKMIGEMRKEYKGLVAAKTELRSKQSQIAVVSVGIQKTEAKISKQKRIKENYVNSINSEIQDIESKNIQLEKASQELTAMILNLGRGGEQRSLGSGSFIKPAEGWLSSVFGTRRHPIFKRYIVHNGIDIAAPIGRPIRASDSGVVIVAGTKPQYTGYGNVTVIDHGRRSGNQYTTVYAHQSRVLVREGQSVKKGDIIGLIGNTGYSTGPHLHFEIRVNGVPINPLDFFRM